jgi:hypothetical protein
MGDRRSLANRLYGPPPAAGAPPSQMLRWIRRMSWRQLPWVVVPLVFGILIGSPLWLWILLGIFVVLMLANQVVLTIRIGRLERHERGR